MNPSQMTPTLMIQGTTSDAGKSVIVAGLCRLLYAKGYRVAPFKPQNMALNSAVTIDGGEIGRSQAVQAEAAGLKPHSDMNPVLLKPNTDKGAQIIIQGKALENMDAITYQGYKQTALPYVLESYHRLASQYEAIIVEGAGSPAEINLREGDIANMGFATSVGADVLIVADIDRGGVFAHLTGTMDCLRDDERALVKGFLINRFRGDQSLLTGGIDWLTEKTGVSTLGVLPFLKGLHIEAEDSVNKTSFTDHTSDESVLKVAIPRLPRVSNHTDFDVLRLHSKVQVEFVEENSPIPSCDLIILPGSKNTIYDLKWLLQQGWREAIHRHLRYGGKLLGICGGYQMIGKMIHDPDGIEGPAGSHRGLGLMDFETTLMPSKQLQNVRGHFCSLPSGEHLPDRDRAIVTGYEIHMGHSQGPALDLPAINLDHRYDGARSPDNQILCSYLHGLFDHPDALQWLLNWAGLKDQHEMNYAQFKEQQIDRVANMLEESLDMGELFRLLRF